jgi:hypothetical protein
MALIIFLSTACLLLLFREFQRNVRDFEKRIEKLETANRQRLPFKAQEEMLDAMAALDRITMDMDVLMAIKENARAHIINAMQVGTKKEK